MALPSMKVPREAKVPKLTARNRCRCCSCDPVMGHADHVGGDLGVDGLGALAEVDRPRKDVDVAVGLDLDPGLRRVPPWFIPVGYSMAAIPAPCGQPSAASLERRAPVPPRQEVGPGLALLADEMGRQEVALPHGVGHAGQFGRELHPGGLGRAQRVVTVDGLA